MRKPVYAALFGLVILTNVFADDDGYDWFYEDYDYQPMLDNDRLMTGLVTCLLQDNECENPIFQLVKRKCNRIGNISLKPSPDCEE